MNKACKKQKVCKYIKLFTAPAIIIIIAAVNLLFFWTNPHYLPDYEKTDVVEIASKDVLNDEDYAELFRQTGLSKIAISEVLGKESQYALKDYQDQFFADIETEKYSFNFNITYQNFISEDSGVGPIKLASLEKGDIIITLSATTLFFNHGHAGIVVSTNPNMTLEALSPGNVSEVGSMDYWQYFSNFIILRLKGASCEKRDQIADYAMKNLAELPYNIIAGVFDFSNKAIPRNTQCASVVFNAYKNFGYDIDSDGGRIVTVRDLLASDKLEVIQIYGLNPEDYIKRIY